jgi:hypothetical protein
MTKSKFRTTTLFLLALACFIESAESQQQGTQSKNLIRQEIDGALGQARWRLGPFRLTPQVRIGAGYDSNSYSSATEPIGDLVFRAAPGLRAAVPIGNRALIEVFEELNFVYYKDVEDLRDVFNVTHIGGAVGGKNAVLRLDTEFRREKARHTSEFDYPMDQRSDRFGAGVDFALGWRHILTLNYQKTRYRIEDNILVDGTPVRNLLDRDENNYALQLTRHLTAKTDLVFEGLYQILDYSDDAAERDADVYGARMGFAFSPRGNLDGLALLGYKRIIPKVEEQADYSGPIGSVDIRAELGRRMRVRGLYARDAQPSVQNNNWFFIENRYGGFFDVFVAAKLFIRPGLVYGTNDYPRPASFTNSEGQIVVESVRDRFQNYSLSINYHLTERLILRLGTNYMIRESNVPVFDKDRLLFNFGITTELWPRGTSQSWL